MTQQTGLGTDGKKGHWERREPPRDESFFKLDIDETLVGRLISKKENETFPGEMIYIFDEKDSGEIKKLNGTTDLDRWMTQYEEGDYLKIHRLKDIILPNKPKPLQKYEVDIWVDE